MELTRITNENMEYFRHLMPEFISGDDDLVKLGAIEEDEAASVCAVCIRENMACIKWLYTDPDMRERGAATELMRLVKELVSDMDLKGFIVDFTDDDEYMDTFLESQEFLIGSNEDVYIVPTEDVVYGTEMDLMAERRDSMDMGHTCDEPAVIRKFMEYAEGLGYSASEIRALSPKFSTVKLDDKGEITGSMLVRESGSDDLVIEYFNNDTGSVDVASLVIALNDAIIRAGRTDGYLIFADHDGASISFVEQLTGNDREDYAVSGSYTAVKLF